MMMLHRQRMGGGRKGRNEVGGDEDGKEHEEEDASTPSSEGEENLDLARWLMTCPLPCPCHLSAPLDAQDLMDAEKTLMMMLHRQRMGGGRKGRNEVGGDEDGKEHEEEDASTPSSEGEENLDRKYNVLLSIYIKFRFI